MDEPLQQLLAKASREPHPAMALIRRRRRQILVHSALYYRDDAPLISDTQFDGWCRDLVLLQEAFPDAAAVVEFATAFKLFTGGTGFHLPYDDPAIQWVAAELRSYAGHEDVVTSIRTGDSRIGAQDDERSDAG